MAGSLPYGFKINITTSPWQRRFFLFFSLARTRFAITNVNEINETYMTHAKAETLKELKRKLKRAGPKLAKVRQELFELDKARGALLKAESDRESFICELLEELCRRIKRDIDVEEMRELLGLCPRAAIEG